jgi:hypothetical protein
MQNVSDLLTNNWAVILMVIVIIALTVRRFIERNKAVKLGEEDVIPLFDKVKVDFFSFAAKFVTLSEIEKTKGRLAARAEIARMIKEYIQNTDLLDKNEKSFLLVINYSIIIDEIEYELIKMGILNTKLPSEPTIKYSSTSIPLEYSVGESTMETVSLSSGELLSIDMNKLPMSQEELTKHREDIYPAVQSVDEPALKGVIYTGFGIVPNDMLGNGSCIGDGCLDTNSDCGDNCSDTNSDCGDNCGCNCDTDN